MSDNFSFPIPNKVLEPYVKQIVNNAIMESIGDGKELVKKAVEAALNTKTDHNGKVSSSTYENRYDMMTALTTNAIRDVANDTVRQIINEMKPMIVACVKADIARRKGEIARLLVDSMEQNICSRWDVKVELKAK